MIDNYTYVIVALLPLASLMLVFQSNPYQALVVRAILGAVAALVYAVLGGADVALTEALVGTMLAITLYVVAVRSSLVMRLGILQEMETETENYFPELITSLRKVAQQHYLRLEIIKYQDLNALEQALVSKEVHATCTKHQANSLVDQDDLLPTNVGQIFNTVVRVRRLFEILQQELVFPETSLEYASRSHKEEKH
ncbi:MAG: DUF4040 domain-containing protein [Cyanobacteria bacterium P01_A01_bin.40]